MDEETNKWKITTIERNEEVKRYEEEYAQIKNKNLEKKILTGMEIVKKIDKGDKDFSNVRIVGVDWAGRDLSGYNFQSSILEWVSFNGCKLIGTNFSNAHIDWVMFSNTNLTKANFENADVWNAIFDSTILNDANFKSSNLRWVAFPDNNMSSADFSGANKFRIYTSWHDFSGTSESEWDLVLGYLRKFGLSDSQIMLFKSKIFKYKSITEKVKFVYDFGRDVMASSPNVYTGLSGTPKTKNSYTSTDTYAVADPYSAKRTKLKEKGKYK